MVPPRIVELDGPMIVVRLEGRSPYRGYFTAECYAPHGEPVKWLGIAATKVGARHIAVQHQREEHA